AHSFWRNPTVYQRECLGNTKFEHQHRHNTKLPRPTSVTNKFAVEQVARCKQALLHSQPDLLGMPVRVSNAYEITTNRNIVFILFRIQHLPFFRSYVLQWSSPPPI